MNKLEFYETPFWVVELLFHNGFLTKKTPVFDPFAGKGAILKHFNESCGTEISAERVNAARNDGFNVFEKDAFEDLDTVKNLCSHGVTVVMNPPFSRAASYLEALLPVKGDVWCLQRIDWLCARSRHELANVHKPDLHILPRRPSFTDDGKTDCRAYAWHRFSSASDSRWSVLKDVQK